jgi:hypothetical protein
MEKTQRLNQENIKQFVTLYRAILETNFLDSELSELIKNNRPEDSGLTKEKYETFFSKHKCIGKQVDKHLSLTNGFSAIFEANINALATERNVIGQKISVYQIDKQYSKLRIYYKVVDHRYPKSLRINSYAYPKFGMELICALSFNSRIFKFVIAKTKDGCDKIWSCEVNHKEATILNESRSYLSSGSKELKLSSSDKFGEILNIYETVTQLVNVELEKLGLEKIISNIELI